jgi:caffeoyl-CoA O-methyltransferase
MSYNRFFIYFSILLWIIWILVGHLSAQGNTTDEKVAIFLGEHKNRWYNWNIPESDGKVLYNLIITNNYTKALEIGTSTGHSAIWIAWALSKTGGKLTTIEINEDRYKKAIENFHKAGLGDYIDAKLADAHDLVYDLEGPFDFVFIDADKNWYRRYFEILLPKVVEGGCITAHNVLNKSMPGIQEYLKFIHELPTVETNIIHSSSSGISVSIKRIENQVYQHSGRQ